jgi:hypothetical protein
MDAFQKKSIEASTLGLKPGHWPHVVQYQGAMYYIEKYNRDREGDLLSALYRNAWGNRGLEVFND